MLDHPVLPELPEQRDIPPIVHQVWIGTDPPGWVLGLWRRVREVNGPGWLYRYWTNDTVAQWPMSWRMASALSGLSHKPIRVRVMLADLIRMEVIHQLGGIYLDSDIAALRRLPADLAGDRPGWLTPRHFDNPRGDRTVVGNGFFAFAPGAPFLADWWNLACQRILYHRSRSSPWLLIGQIPNLLLPGYPDIEVLPFGLFPDIEVYDRADMLMRYRSSSPSLDELAERYPEALAVHLSNWSWADTPPPRVNTLAWEEAQ